jgi:hypothetical protein
VVSPLPFSYVRTVCIILRTVSYLVATYDGLSGRRVRLCGHKYIPEEVESSPRANKRVSVSNFDVIPRVSLGDTVRDTYSSVRSQLVEATGTVPVFLVIVVRLGYIESSMI